MNLLLDCMNFMMILFIFIYFFLYVIPQNLKHASKAYRRFIGEASGRGLADATSAHALALPSQLTKHLHATNNDTAQKSTLHSP